MGRLLPIALLATALVASAILVVSAPAQSALDRSPYVAAYSGPANADGHFAVFAMRADGTDVRQLTSGEALDFAGPWSPDGQQLAFEQVDDSRVFSSIGTVSLEGGPARVIDGGYAENPSWSSDGAWIAYQEQTDYGTGGGRADTTFDLWVAHPDGSSLRRLGSGGNTGSSEEWIGWGLAWDWSPDGKRIAFMQPDPRRPEDSDGDFGFRLVVVDVATGRIQARVPLTTDYTLAEPWLGWAWSPDGQRLAFIRPVGPLPKRSKAPYELAVLDVSTGTVRVAALPLVPRLVRAFGYSSSLLEVGTGWNWSPDGARIAVVQPDPSQRDPKTGRVRLRLGVVNGRNGSVWRVPGFLSTARPYGSSLAAEGAGWSWSPDARRIALVRETQAQAGVFDLLVADAARRKLRNVGRGAVAIWSPDGTRLAVTWGKPIESCSDVWIVAAATGSRARIVRHPPHACDDAVQWSPDGSFLAFERVRSKSESTFTVSSDGTNLHELRTASPSEVQWPDDCKQFFTVGGEWVLRDLFGELRLVARPALADDAAASWRC